MPLPTIDALTTPRLLVRGVDEGDLNDLFDVNGDPDVTRFLPYGSWKSAADALAWLARMRAIEAAGDGRQLVIVTRDSARVIGTLLLFRYDESSARIEIGYALARRHWRAAMMAEALRAVCRHAFDSMAIRRIEAQVNPDNLASNQLLTAIGFTLEGRLRQRWVSQGAAVDSNFYGLLATDG